MPKGTRVHRCVEKLTERYGYSGAIGICQKSFPRGGPPAAQDGTKNTPRKRSYLRWFRPRGRP